MTHSGSLSLTDKDSNGIITNKSQVGVTIAIRDYLLITLSIHGTIVYMYFLTFYIWTATRKVQNVSIMPVEGHYVQGRVEVTTLYTVQECR